MEISQAFNNGNYKKASEVKRKIFASSNAPLSLKYRAILIVSELKDHMASLDQKTIDEISSYLYKSSDWVKNKEALILFGDSMPRMNSNILKRRMKQIINAYSAINKFPDRVQR